MNFRKPTSLGLLLACLASAADSNLAVVNSIGLYDTDGSILYSVYLASRVEKLTGVALGGHVPAGTRFLEMVDVPKGATFEGVRDNVAAWTVPDLEADTVIGPFTYRVRPDGTTPPWAAPAALATHRGPEVGAAEFAGVPTPLQKLADGGSITFDRRGTLDAEGKNAPVKVGATGILVFVPEGAVEQETTLTFERRRVEDAKLPSNAEDTWWCGLYQITVSPQVASQKSISFSLPARRALPIGVPVSAFADTTDSGWRKYSASAPREFGFGGSGLGCFGGFSQFTCTGGGFCSFNCGFNQGFGFGFGVNTVARLEAVRTGSQIASQTGLNVTAASSISDGTSNIIAILIGRR